MASDDDVRMKVECKECRFSRVVGPDDDRLPGEVVIEHGDETGHRLDVEPLED